MYAGGRRRPLQRRALEHVPGLRRRLRARALRLAHQDHWLSERGRPPRAPSQSPLPLFPKSGAHSSPRAAPGRRPAAPPPARGADGAGGWRGRELLGGIFGAGGRGRSNALIQSGGRGSSPACV